MHIDSNRSKKVALFGVFLTFMLIMGLIDRMIPLDGIAPGMRLGLVNLAVIISLYIFSVSKTLVLVIMKCLMTALLSGSVMALLYSVPASLASLTAMYVLMRAKIASPIGVSVVGAAFHNSTQIFVAGFIFGSWGILVYLPFLLAVGTASGFLIGKLARAMLPKLWAYIDIEQRYREQLF